VSAKGTLVCQVCGTALNGGSEACPVCALRGALGPETTSVLDFSSELRFEHYQVLKNKDGTPVELGRGAMGITYKALDVPLQCPVALKIVNARFIGDDSARRRFVREARAAASVRHPNVASVFHLGESGGNYFYAMEFVDGETLGKLIQRSGRLEPDVALEVVAQVAAGLMAIEKRGLVHRDVKASNIMVSWDEGRLESVKIIDLGLAKGVAEETISTTGGFIGTPGYASPEQFAGIGIDIRSDLYSLGITLWEMLSGKLPFQGSPTELMYQHQHAAPPSEKLKNVPAPIVVLLEVVLAKDPSQRFQGAAQLQKALPKVREALASGSRLSANDLRSTVDKMAEPSERKPRNRAVRWLVASAFGLVGLMLGWFFFSGYRWSFFNQGGAAAIPAEKSIAVLPFESLSTNKDDAYFANGVQGEILNNLAKIAQLKVISRTSVMQYRADAKRDLRQIAKALGVANVLEGTVRRDANHVRVSTELVDARNDNTIWADSYDRDLPNIFAIQSEVAQTIANKLTATLSPDEKRRIEAKPTENLEAYDLYLRAKELIVGALVSNSIGPAVGKQLRDAIDFLEQAVRLDPQFTLAYCASAEAHDLSYGVGDATSEQHALADTAIRTALSLQPDLPEVHLAYALHFYSAYRDYDRARVQLAIARRGLPNDVKAIWLAALMDRRQGNFEKAIWQFNEAITRDPANRASIVELAITLVCTRQLDAAGQAFNRAIDLAPDQPELQVQKALYVNFWKTGNNTAMKSAIAAFPPSMANDRDVLCYRLVCALQDRDWQLAKEQLEKMKSGHDNGFFSYATHLIPVSCYSILLARLQGQPYVANASFAETREELNQAVQMSPEDAKLLSNLAIVDALLGRKQDAIGEAKHAIEMRPTSKDALAGPGIVANLALVYAWTNELDLAFETLRPLSTMTYGVYYGQLKVDPLWDPIRKDPRYGKLLAELAPKD
jgi:serine/threonine protein kinase/Flp pilus assembly protein TadD